MTREEYKIRIFDTWGGKEQKIRAVLGLFEELGEVVGKLKKQKRGDNVTDEAIEKEVGDVLFYLEMCEELGVKKSEVKKILDEHKNKIQYFTSVLFEVGAFDYLFSSDGIESEWFIEILEVVGFDLDKIRQQNIDKLAQRKQNGTIKGNGDNR